MKRGSIASALALVLVASLFALPVCYAADKVITLKVANWFPITHQQNVLLEAWCKESALPGSPLPVSRRSTTR